MDDQTQTRTEEDRNPYIGPLAFRSDEAQWYYGRQRESAELLSLLLARRLVLFYAQSGAGKTSLLNASLVPTLKGKEHDFEVLPIGRVGDAIELPEKVNNIFIYNLITNLGLTGTDDPKHLEHLASLRLSDFLLDLVYDGQNFRYVGNEKTAETAPEEETLEEAGSEPITIRSRALIIDQFEEIFTVHPEYEAARNDFFWQITEAMNQDPYLYVLFSMRGDYYDRLTPYIHLLPDRLRARFYMERMGPDQALKAVRMPAAQEKRYFTQEVSQELVTYLRRMKSADSAGQNNVILDPYVETVQLQVVCRQLWQSLDTAPGDTITLEDVKRVATEYVQQNRTARFYEQDGVDPLAAFIDNALAGYYEEAIHKVLGHPEVTIPEYKLRDWFSNRLITSAETRNLLARGEQSTAGISETAVNLLDTVHHLIRNDMRGGRPFIELVHDSFIEPILNANREWEIRRARQIPWLNAAFEYSTTKNPNLLLVGDNLTNALLIQESLKDLPPEASAYLDASLERQREKQAEAKQREEKRRLELKLQREKAEGERQRAEAAEEAHARQRRLSRIATAISVVAVIVGIVAFLSWNEANEQHGIAENQRATAVIAQETAEAAEQEAVTSEAEAIVARATAEAAAREAIRAEDGARRAEAEALAAKNETESLRLADIAEIFYEEGRMVPALLVGHQALEANYTKEATKVLTRTLTAYLSLSPDIDNALPPDRDGLMTLACQSAGRNLTESELSAKFDEPYDPDLLIICDQYGLHLSFAEQAVRECSNLLDAIRFFNMAKPPLDEDGQTLTFSEWSQQIFVNQALINKDRACLDLAGLTDQEASIFLSVVQQLNTPTSEGDSPEEAYQNVVALDNLRNGLPDYAVAALDPLLTTKYGDYCVNLSLKLETAIMACQKYNDIRTGDFVAFTPERVADASTNFRRFTFEGRSDQVATFELATFGEIDTFSLIVTDPVSEPLQTINRQSNPGVLETYSYLLNDNGTYTFDIQWFQGAPPELELNIELDEPGAITFGERQGGSGDGPWWQFDGTQGDILKITMNALDSGDPVLRLINSQGFIIREDDDSGEGKNALFETILPADDTYYINAGWYEYDSGEYSLLVEKVASEIEYGQTVEGTAVRRYWQFEASQDDLLIITMEAVSDGDPNLTLLDETGAQIAFNDNGPSGLDAEIFAIIPAAGVYYLETGWNNDPARYSITVDKIEPQIIDLTELTTVEGTSDQRVWQFSAQPGDIVAITMDAVGDNVPFLRLLDANNNELTNNIGNNEDQAATIQWQIWDDKTYYIEAGWIGNPGPYTLAIAQTEPGFLSLGQMETGEPDEFWWLIQGAQSEVVEINLDADEDESFPQLYIYSDEGVELPYNYVDNPGDAYLAIAFPKDGLYYLRIRWQEMASPYTILMNRLDPDGDPDEAAELFKRSALFLIQQADIEDGLTLLEPIQNLETSQEIIFPDEYNIICRYGSLWGYAEQVITYCETAVNLDTSNGDYRDSYGIALALLGDYEAAIVQLELYILAFGEGPESNLRQEWIDALEAGENPFEDEELLEMLRNQL